MDLIDAYFGRKIYEAVKSKLLENINNLNSNLASDVLKTTVSEIMVEKIITVPQTLSIGDLCQLFADNNIGGVPIVKDNEIVGIITERDVLNSVRRA